jgi:hypothetical protein
MSYANDILAKAESAAVAMLRAAALATIPSASVLAGYGSDDVILPRVVCSCDSADYAEIYDGNWDAALEVEVRAAKADTTRAEFRAMCAEVFAQFMRAREDVEAALSNADDPFTVFACYPQRQTRSIELGADGQGAEWSVKMTFLVKCCGSVIG